MRREGKVGGKLVNGTLRRFKNPKNFKVDFSEEAQRRETQEEEEFAALKKSNPDIDVQFSRNFVSRRSSKPSGEIIWSRGKLSEGMHKKIKRSDILPKKSKAERKRGIRHDIGESLSQPA